MKIRCTWILSFVSLAFSSSAFADTPTKPSSYQQIVPGEKYVFVMIAPVSVEEDVRFWKEEMVALIREIRSKYTRSGLYRNDGSVEPIWTVDWYASRVLPMSDNIHLIRAGEWPWLREDRSPNLDCEAVSFFANGQLLKTYRVSDLVVNPDMLKCTVSHYFWLQEAWESGESEFTIKTLDGNWFTFDLRTGEITYASRVRRVVIMDNVATENLFTRWGWWAALASVAGIGAVWIILRRKLQLLKGATIHGKSSP